MIDDRSGVLVLLGTSKEDASADGLPLHVCVDESQP